MPHARPTLLKHPALFTFSLLILFERNLPDLEKHPDKYAPNRWHVGSVMLIGEPVE